MSKDKKLKLYDNHHIVCSQCNKLKYMGWLHGAEMCICTNHMVYDNRDKEKKVFPFENTYTYE